MDLSTSNQPPGTFDTPPPTPAPEPPGAVVDDPLDALLKQIVGGWFILTDGQGAVSKWSEPAELLFGKAAPDALGHLFFDGLLTGELSNDAEQWRRFLAAGDPPHARALVEVTARYAPTDQRFPLEAVFVPVKLDEGFDFSLFLEDLSFDLPMNLMLLRMRQQHPVVVRALRAALDEEPQTWDGWRTAGTMVAFRPLAPTPWVETELAKRVEERSRADAEREEAITNSDPGVHGGTIDELDDAAAVVARLLSALERIDELERVAGRLPGQVEEARREAESSRVRAAAAEREAKHARAELERLEPMFGAAADQGRAELLARLERLEGGHVAEREAESAAALAARVERLEQERLESAAGAEARLTAALTEANAARTDLERRLADLESAAAEAGAGLNDELRAALERLERERAESDAAREELSTALERVEREHGRELEAARGELASARERIDTVDREGEQARARLDELREDAVRGAETANALRAELDAVRAGEAEARESLRTELAASAPADRDARAAVEALRADLAALRDAEARSRDELHALRGEVEHTRGNADATPWRDEIAALRDELAVTRESGLELDELRRQLEHLRERSVARSDFDDLHRAFDALRDGGVGRTDLEAIREQLATLADGWAAKGDLDGVRAALDGLGERVPTRDELDTLKNRLDELAPRDETEALRTTVDELGDRVDAARTQAEAGAAEAEQAHQAAREAIDRVADVDRGAGSVLAEVKATGEATGDRLEEVAGLAHAAHDAAGSARADQDELRAAVARLGGEVEVAREQLQQAADEALGARQQAATAGEAATAAREDAGRAREDAEARASDVLAELAAVREIAEQATSGVGELRVELAAMREETAAARVQAELANAVAENAHATAEAAKLEDERLEALQAEVQFAISTMEEMKAGLTSAGQAALVARREAEQAKKAAEHAGDGTGEHVTAVFREILGLAAKGRPRTHQKGAADAPPEPREPRHGFDDETVPMAVIGTDGKFKELNPSFCRLVGYQEHEFAKAAWPSPHDRHLYAQQQEQFSELVCGALDAVPVQSTYMHGQGLMVPVVGEITAVKGEDGLTSHLLLRAEERERAL